LLKEVVSQTTIINGVKTTTVREVDQFGNETVTQESSNGQKTIHVNGVPSLLQYATLLEKNNAKKPDRSPPTYANAHYSSTNVPVGAAPPSYSSVTSSPPEYASAQRRSIPVHFVGGQSQQTPIVIDDVNSNRGQVPSYSTGRL